MRRVAVVLAAAVFLIQPAIAIAKEGGGAGVTVGPSGDPVVFVGAPGGAVPGGPSGGSGSVTCGLYEVTGTVSGGVQLGVGAPATDPQEGSSYFLVCRTPDGTIVYQQLITYSPGTVVVDAATLARQAYRELPLLYPQPYTAPPANVAHLVGVRTWMWIDASQWQPRSATASIPGLSATATAEPVEVRWDMGDGTVVACDGPGTPYDPAVPDNEQHSYCSHVFEHDGPKQVRATIVWRVRWTATNGSSGALPDIERATQFPVQVEQRQAVIRG